METRLKENLIEDFLFLFYVEFLDAVINRSSCFIFLRKMCHTHTHMIKYVSEERFIRRLLCK